jgi:hypothetical protein
MFGPVAENVSTGGIGVVADEVTQFLHPDRAAFAFFHHQALEAITGQVDGGREPAHAAADNDGIVNLVEASIEIFSRQFHGWRRGSYLLTIDQECPF